MSYFLLFITTLITIGLALFNATKPPMNDQGGIYGLAVVGLTAIFAISSLLLTINMLAKGSFHWVAVGQGTRIAIGLGGWLCIVLTTLFCSFFKWEWHANEEHLFPYFLRWLALYHGQLWIPLLWLLGCLLSINNSDQSGQASVFLKVTFYIAMLISMLYSAGLAFAQLKHSAMTFRDQQSVGGTKDVWHRTVLDEIARHKPTDSIVNLLSQSTGSRPSDIREAALAQIKSHPNWEAELLALLNDRQSYREVYYFLDGNAVTHPEQFAQPLNASILNLAADIRAEINRDRSNLSEWSFSTYQINNLLEALNRQFQNRGVNFYPNMIALKQALESAGETNRFRVTNSVQDWLDNNKP